MRKLWDLFISKLKEHRVISVATVVLSIFEKVNKFYSIINYRFLNQVVVSLITILIILFFSDFFNEIINRKVEKFTVVRNFYSDTQIKVAKAIKGFSYLLFLIPISFLYQDIRNIYLEGQSCSVLKAKMGLLIANFNHSKGFSDPFSITLFGKLNADLQFADTINIEKIPRYMSETDNYLDTIKNMFYQNCSDRGLIIFGDRIGNDAFNCRIYSFNFMNFKAALFSRTQDKTIIYIQNPNLLNFTVDYEADMISKFIFGLLYSKKGDYEKANKFLNMSLDLNTNKNNIQFISICRLFIGNNLLKEGNMKSALVEYNQGIKIDSNNEYLHYNIAAVNNHIGNEAKAFEEYETAHRLNNELENPLAQAKKSKSEQPNYATNYSNIRSKSTIKRGDSLKMNDSINQKIVMENWNEHCKTIVENKKFGVINNKGDTIVPCDYDEIINFPFKNANCFIVKLNNKYGAIIHLHTNTGYNIGHIKIEYSSKYVVEQQVEYCVSNNHLE